MTSRENLTTPGVSITNDLSYMRYILKLMNVFIVLMYFFNIEDMVHLLVIRKYILPLPVR